MKSCAKAYDGPVVVMKTAECHTKQGVKHISALKGLDVVMGRIEHAEMWKA